MAYPCISFDKLLILVKNKEINLIKYKDKNIVYILIL